MNTENIVDKIWKKLTIALFFATIIIVFYNIFFGTIDVNIRYLVSYYAGISLIILLIGWSISAYRLKIIVESLSRDKQIRLLDCLKARLLGGLLANITPSSIGGEPARAFYISRSMGIDLSRSYAMTIYEVYYDVIIVNIAGFNLSMFYLPKSVPVLMVSIFMVVSWISIHVYLKNKSIIDKTILLLEKFLPPRIVTKLYNHISDFAQHYHDVSKKTKPGTKLIVIVLTILYNSIWGLAIVPLQHIKYAEISISIILNAISSYYMMQSISALPTPGGSGMAEYGLLIGLEPCIALTYRIIYYYSTIVMGLVVLTKTMRTSSKNP